MNKKISLSKGCIIFIILYAVIMAVFYICAKDGLNYRYTQSDMLSNESVIGEITNETEILQNFKSTINGELNMLSFYMATYSRENTSEVTFSIFDGDKKLADKTVSTADIKDNQNFDICFDSIIKLEKDKLYTISVTSNAESGNGVTIYCGNKISAGKADITQEIPQELQVSINGKTSGSALCYIIKTKENLIYGKLFPYFAAIAGVFLTMYCIYLVRCSKSGKSCLVIKIIDIFKKYRFLIKQLVARDFKTKYKRSVLGVLWSFLNPILTMAVQYIVFSTLFKSNIPNFALYLIIGIVCFNFFTEAVGMSLTSITGNAALITKVYMPKYIYPVSRTISSGINLLLSLIPLLGVMIITRAPFTKAALLFPIPLICLFIFSLGIGMILSTMMVFFRDTQFLWNVISMIWMYITPIFYPESIIPAKFMLVFKLNPMYHIIRLLRTMLINGVSPEPKAYFICIFMSVAVMVIGAIIFKKNQDKFVLNI